MNKVKSIDGTLIAYDVSGSGPAMIYITGAFRAFKSKEQLNLLNLKQKQKF